MVDGETAMFMYMCTSAYSYAHHIFAFSSPHTDTDQIQGQINLQTT